MQNLKWQTRFSGSLSNQAPGRANWCDEGFLNKLGPATPNTYSYAGSLALAIFASSPELFMGELAEGHTSLARKNDDLPVDSLLEDTEYKRDYKTSRGFSGKNVELFLGNFVSLLARERVGAKKAFDRLQTWECWPVIHDHYAAKDMSEHDIYKHIKNLLEERNVRWGRAV